MIYSIRALRRATAEGRSNLDSIKRQLEIIAEELLELAGEHGAVRARRAALGPVMVDAGLRGIVIDYRAGVVAATLDRTPTALLGVVSNTIAERSELDQRESEIMSEMHPLERRSAKLNALVLAFTPVILGLEERVTAVDAGLPDPRRDEEIPDWHPTPSELSPNAIMNVR